MFGAVGLYCDEYFFAVIDDDMFYLKTDETNCEAFKARGMRQFMLEPGKPETATRITRCPPTCSRIVTSWSCGRGSPWRSVPLGRPQGGASA